MLKKLSEAEVEEQITTSDKKFDAEVSKARNWVKDQIAKGKRQRHSMFVMLTPALATALMELNTVNRNISRHNIEVLMRDVREGRWVVNGQSISITQSGILGDGQHRLQMVILTGQPVEVNLCFGVDDESRYTTDIGKPKTAANFLHMKGYKNANNASAIVNLILQYQRMGLVTSAGADRATKTEVSTGIARLRGVEATIERVVNSDARLLGAVSPLGFAHYEIKKKCGAAVADEFIDKVVTGENITSTSPIYLLRKRLLKLRGAARVEDKCALIFIAFNHWRRGESVTKLQMSDKFPKLEK